MKTTIKIVKEQKSVDAIVFQVCEWSGGWMDDPGCFYKLASFTCRRQNVAPAHFRALGGVGVAHLSRTSTSNNAILEHVQSDPKPK